MAKSGSLGSQVKFCHGLLYLLGFSCKLYGYVQYSTKWDDQSNVFLEDFNQTSFFHLTKRLKCLHKSKPMRWKQTVI